jgi:hypothetical protein
MRTYRYFMCENWHRGEERTSENDQSYSTHWESVSVKSLKLIGDDGRGYVASSAASATCRCSARRTLDGR